MILLGELLVAVGIMAIIFVLTVIISTIISRFNNDLDEEEMEELFNNEAEIIEFESKIEENAFDSLSLEEQIACIEKENEEYAKQLAHLRQLNREKKKESRYAFIRFFPWLFHKLFDDLYIVVE